MAGLASTMPHLLGLVFALAFIGMISAVPRQGDDENDDVSESKNCSIPIDLLLLIDASASVDPQEMEIQMGFAIALVNKLDVEEGKVHIAISFFANYFRHQYCFSHDKADILDKLSNLECDECQKGQTSTGLAFQGARDVVFQDSCGARDQKTTPWIVFHLTDGASTEHLNGYGDDFMAKQKDYLWSHGVYVITVAVGNKMKPGKPFYERTKEVSHKIFYAATFDALDGILTETEEAICEQAKEGPAPVEVCEVLVDLAVVMDYSGSMEPRFLAMQKAYILDVVDRISAVDGVFLNAANTLVATGVHPRFCFDTYGNDSSLIHQAFANTDCPECINGRTAIGETLKYVREDVFGDPACGARDGSTKLVLLLTDAKSTEAESEWKKQADDLKALGYEVLVVGFDPEALDSAAYLASPDGAFAFYEADGLMARLAEILPNRCGDLRKPSCEEGWSYNPADDKCMKYYGEKAVSADKVETLCVRKGGADAMQAYPSSGTMDMMIEGLGFGDQGKNMIHTGLRWTGSTWDWSNGDPMDYERFRRGEENKGSEKFNCAFMHKKAGRKWIARPCKKKAAYACVKPHVV